MNVPDARDGVLEPAGTRWRLRFVRHLPHSVEKVWAALTEERHLAEWFPTTIEGELRTGAPLRFAFRGEEFPASIGRMIEFEPYRVMEFAWGTPPGTVDHDHEVSRLELRPTPDGCELTLLTTYDRLGKSARDAAGWHVCLDLLEGYMHGDRVEGSHELWEPFNRRYMAMFGPEASTIDATEQYEEEADAGEVK